MYNFVHMIIAATVIVSFFNYTRLYKTKQMLFVSVTTIQDRSDAAGRKNKVENFVFES